jgi:phosphonate transport system permease protein
MSARLHGWIAAGAALLLVWASFRYLSIDLGRLFAADTGRLLLEFVLRFLPPDTSMAYLRKVGAGALETLAIAGVGTLLAVGVGLALAVPASGRLGVPARMAARLALNFLRSVPELVWGAIMVLAAGLGPFAGTLALALHTSGVLGRLFAEALENAPPEPARTLAEAGSASSLAFLYGTLPGVVPQLVAYSLYRCEVNVRMASVLGFVGAGGLGHMLHYELALLREPQAATVIIAMLALIVLIDAASAWIRHRMQAA